MNLSLIGHTAFVNDNNFTDSLQNIPAEDWSRNWPANRTIMLRMTSKRVKDAVDKIRPPTVISFNKSFWNNPSIDTVSEGDCTIAKKQELMMMYLSEISTWNVIVSLEICNIELFYEQQNVIGMCSPGTISLTSALNTGETLTNLNLNFCKIGLTGVTKLALFVVKCQRLTHLNICNNKIGPKGIKSLATALENCLLLSHIDLSWNHIGPNGADSLSKVLTLLKIKYLNLCGNTIGNTGSEKITQSLINYPVLQHLDLSWNHIGPYGASSLARMLSLVQSPSETLEPVQAVQLKYLNLGGNRIDDTGAEKLTIALTKYPVLKHLNLNNNQIGPKGAASIARLLLHCSSLEHLDLCSNYFNDTGTESLASVLGQCSSLIHLNLCGNIIGNTGTEKLSISLTNCTALMHLDLSYNKIGPNGVCSLSRMLVQCTTLRHLDLRYNMLGYTGKECLIQVQTQYSLLNTLYNI